MEVDDRDVLASLQEAVDNGVQGTVRPGRPATAEEHAVRMAVLARRHGAEIRHIAYLLAIGRELCLGGSDRRLAEVDDLGARRLGGGLAASGAQ